MIISCGVYSGADGVWVHDRSATKLNSTLLSGWIRSTTDTRASIRRVRLWLRETGIDVALGTRISVQLRRDWRAEVVSSALVRRHPDQESTRAADPAQPSFLDNGEAWGDVVWRTRRPYWASVDVDIPSCEVFQIGIVSGGRYEILGFQFEEASRDNNGARDFR